MLLHTRRTWTCRPAKETLKNESKETYGQTRRLRKLEIKRELEIIGVYRLFFFSFVKEARFGPRRVALIAQSGKRWLFHRLLIHTYYKNLHTSKIARMAKLQLNRVW